MKKLIKYVLIALSILFFIGLIVSDKKEEKTKDTNESEVIQVTPKQEKKKSKMDLDDSEFWEKFDPIVKVRIYDLIEQKDCSELQKEFNTTADNMDRIQASGGSGSRNLDLMDFLTEQMEDLGCY